MNDAKYLVAIVSMAIAIAIIYGEQFSDCKPIHKEIHQLYINRIQYTQGYIVSFKANDSSKCEYYDQMLLLNAFDFENMFTRKFDNDTSHNVWLYYVLDTETMMYASENIINLNKTKEGIHKYANFGYSFGKYIGNITGNGYLGDLIEDSTTICCMLIVGVRNDYPTKDIMKDFVQNGRSIANRLTDVLC
jgi:hypothetical protein